MTHSNRPQYHSLHQQLLLISKRTEENNFKNAPSHSKKHILFIYTMEIYHTDIEPRVTTTTVEYRVVSISTKYHLGFSYQSSQMSVCVCYLLVCLHLSSSVQT